MILQKDINKNIKVVKLEILKIKAQFWNKDLSSLDSINEETHKGKYMEHIWETYMHIWNI